MAISNGYTTLAALKQRLNITDTSEDTALERAIEASSRQIDAETEQFFYQVAESRTFIPDNPFLLKLDAWNTLVSVTSIDTDPAGDGTFGTSWDASDYQLLTRNHTPNQGAAPAEEPFTEVRAVGAQEFPLPSGGARRLDLVRIDGTWGWPATPTVVAEACLILAGETFKLRDAPFGVAGFGEFGALRVRDNPKASRLLARYLPLAVI